MFDELLEDSSILNVLIVLPMTTQVPDLIVVALPLIMHTAVAMAVLGLVSSLSFLMLRSRPVAGGEGETTSRSAIRLFESQAANLASIGFWLALTGLHLLAWQLYFGRDSKYHLHGLSYLSSFIAILLAWRLWRLSHRAGSGRWTTVSPLGMQLLQVIGLSCCSTLLAEGPKPLYPQTPPGELVVCKTARTDAGTPIHLYERAVEPSQLESFYSATQHELINMTRQAMFREPAAPQVNCHGWVFSGQHTVKGEDVPVILKENGYQEVDHPHLNDLVVYADADGMVLHTGLVCGFFGEGTPLIQSKWGITGIYVHLVGEQPYSSNYQFYRSARHGHELHSCEPGSGSLGDDSNLAQISKPIESTPTCQRPTEWVGEPQLAD